MELTIKINLSKLKNMAQSAGMVLVGCATIYLFGSSILEWLMYV